jgi:hypothetical protein
MAQRFELALVVEPQSGLVQAGPEREPFFEQSFTTTKPPVGVGGLLGI